MLYRLILHRSVLISTPSDYYLILHRSVPISTLEIRRGLVLFNLVYLENAHAPTAPIPILGAIYTLSCTSNSSSRLELSSFNINDFFFFITIKINKSDTIIKYNNNKVTNKLESVIDKDLARSPSAYHSYQLTKQNMFIYV